MRATLLARGVKLPPWRNKMANKILIDVLQREREQELAAIDALIYSYSVLIGIPKESFGKKMETLNSIRESLSAVIMQQAYDPEYQRNKIEQKIKNAEADSKIMEKVQMLDKITKGGS